MLAVVEESLAAVRSRKTAPDLDRLADGAVGAARAARPGGRAARPPGQRWRRGRRRRGERIADGGVAAADAGRDGPPKPSGAVHGSRLARPAGLGSKAESASAAPAPATPPATILVVDDDEENRAAPGAAARAARVTASGPRPGRPRGAGAPPERAGRPGPARRHDARPRRARGAGVAQAGSGAPSHPGADDLGARRDSERGPVDRARRRGLPAEALRPRAAQGPDRGLPREEAAP